MQKMDRACRLTGLRGRMQFSEWRHMANLRIALG